MGGQAKGAFVLATDVVRLCALEATWGIAIKRGSRLASIAPMAACCAWEQDAWNHQAEGSEVAEGLVGASSPAPGSHLATAPEARHGSEMKRRKEAANLMAFS